MKVDRLDVAMVFLAVGINLSARVVSAYAIEREGAVELNAFSRGFANNALGLLLVVGISLALWILIDPYRKLALSMFAGQLSADLTHDIFFVLRLSPYTSFSLSVAVALMFPGFMAFYLFFKNDPRKEELKKRRNWKIFNI